MKKLLLIALLSFGAQAKYTAEDCKVIAEHAEVIMAMRQDGADMSNTQFAVWALKTAEKANSIYPIPGLAGSLTLLPTRRDYAGRFIMRSTDDPGTLGYPSTSYIQTSANDSAITQTENGALYGVQGSPQYTGFNGGAPYGSISAASLWASYCVDAPWKILPIPSSANGWNIIEWFKTHIDELMAVPEAVAGS